MNPDAGIHAMQLHDDLLTVFSARIDDQEGSPSIQIPAQEVDLGSLTASKVYRVAIFQGIGVKDESTTAEPAREHQRSAPSADPPVSKGEQLDVEIEDVGEQGDGVARVGPGYIVFVPETALGDRVTIEITEVRENFGFAKVVEPEPATE